jgi:cytochrome P450
MPQSAPIQLPAEENAMLIDGIPPGPRTPLAVQTAAMLMRQGPYLKRQQRKFGTLFSMRVAGFDQFVVVSDPALVKQVFTADPKVLHAGERNPLSRVLGEHSMFSVDEAEHLEQRKLLLPAFKGQRLKSYESVIEEIAIKEFETWPEGMEFAVSNSMQRITLRAILRAVFGASGDELHELERLIPPWTTLGSKLSTAPWLQRNLGPRSPGGAFLSLRAQMNVVLDRLIAKAKGDPDLEDRPDVLASLVQAVHTDGSSMTNPEIRDQLVTMLAAGHETTAHQLSWGVERLRRHPEILARLVDEVDAGGHALRDATIRELQRTRPVIFFAGRHVVDTYDLGGYRLPRNTLIALAARLTHFDERLFEDPLRFNPDRFLNQLPDTYEWIPFGGGMRRCIGATFAHMEMDIVLRVLFERVTLVPTSEPDEAWKFRGVAWAPADGGRAIIKRRMAA